MATIACLSDTHLQTNFLVPPADIVVHAGDHTFSGKMDEIAKAYWWYGKLPHKYKIAIAGNHDGLHQNEPSLARQIAKENGVIYLEDETVEVMGLKFYGSPWQPEFCNWFFNLSRYDGSLAEKWKAIPDDTDVLITHGPPLQILDKTAGYEGVVCGKPHYAAPQNVGCYDLRERVRAMKLKLHVFGHIHHSSGIHKEPDLDTVFVNAAVCDEKYRPTNAPIVIKI